MSDQPAAERARFQPGQKVRVKGLPTEGVSPLVVLQDFGAAYECVWATAAGYGVVKLPNEVLVAVDAGER